MALSIALACKQLERTAAQSPTPSSGYIFELITCYVKKSSLDTQLHQSMFYNSSLSDFQLTVTISHLGLTMRKH